MRCLKNKRLLCAHIHETRNLLQDGFPFALVQTQMVNKYFNFYHDKDPWLFSLILKLQNLLAWEPHGS